MKGFRYLIKIRSHGFCLIVGTMSLWQLGATPALAQGSRSATSQNPIESLRMVEGDEQGNDMRALKTELLVTSVEERAVEQLQMLIRRERGKEIEPDLWLRLGDLYMRRARSERFFDLHRSSDQGVSFLPREMRNREGRQSIQAAIDVYERIQRSFPRYNQMDLVIFNNAFARQQVGQGKQAEQRYLQLIQSYPRSPLIPDAHLAVGEINFDRQDFAKALEHFDQIKNYPQSRVYPYGLYKAAWSHYNLRDTEAALRELERVVEFGRRVAELGADARLDLRREALTDMTLFFSEVRLPQEAYRYFTRQAGELGPDESLLRLARLYSHHGKFEQKKVVLNDFIRNLRLSDLLAEAHNDLVHNYENMRLRREAVGQLSQFHALCAENSRWMRHQQAQNSEVASSCQELLNQTSLQLAGKWLRTWRNNREHSIFAESAEKAFEIYLERNPKGEESDQARFAYAELLFQRDQFRRASEQYAIVGGRAGSEGALGHDASYAALLSLQMAVGEGARWSDADEKSFHELAKSYVDNHPKGEFRLDVEFQVAFIAYEKGRYDEAGPVFLRLGQQFSGEARGLKSQDLYLDILNLKKDYTGLKKYAAELLGARSSLDPERQKNLENIYEQAYFMEVQTQEERGEYTQAIQGYKQFALDNPKSQLAEKAWWNAVQLQFRVQNFMDGARDAVEFQRLFPESEQATNALLRAAQTFESMAQLGEAASVLRTLAQVDSKAKLKWLALAADFLALSGELAEAQRLYSQLVSSGDPEVSFKALESQWRLAESTGAQSRYWELTEQIAASGRQPQASLAAASLVKKLYEENKPTEAFARARGVLNMGRTASPRARAQARYYQARILEDEFVSASLRSRAERVALVLGIKTERLEKAQQAYQATIRFGDPEYSIKAMRRLAGCYDHFVKALREMPLPTGLTASDEPIFRNELENLAIPMEEKSVDTIAQALAAAKRMQLRDGTIADLQSELDQLNMRQRQELHVEVVAPEITLPSFPRRAGT